jgi:malate synthase
MKNTPDFAEHSTFEIGYYHQFISPSFARHLLSEARSIDEIPGLAHVGERGGLETADALKFLIKLYDRIKPQLKEVLVQRIEDRKFIDERVRACYQFNQKLGRDIRDADYQTIIGLEDSDGRIVLGPRSHQYCQPGGKPVAPIPAYLQGPHVTLFGPPDSAKMAINAMNAYHRKLKSEPPIVQKLLAEQKANAKWGADDEDSKTPLRQDLIDAAVNLTGCFERNLSLDEGPKSYRLANENLSTPIKRFPGLALPCNFMYWQNNPLPLHLYDFALHLFRNWHIAESLCFYVPKLENEEEAKYIHTMVATAEEMIQELHPEYRLGTIRLMIVLENPRAILRTHEIMDALHPYFVGASLGWHDYLASTARVFKEDANYRIPVKADPNIVIKYIKASHSLLADVVGSRGGIKVGGMYGILPQNPEISSPSFQIALKGFFKDVITQMKRDLTGFWVAHPDFVRLGLAIVEAWRQFAAGRQEPLTELVREIFHPEHRDELVKFIDGKDIGGLDQQDPGYVRSLLVADIKESDFIPNNHPDEIRYNVFQALQYLTDWLSGNGCVALPTTVDGVPVRVMDDLATAERSRWEVWHEIYHGRFSIEDFLRIAHEEMRFIRKDLSDSKKIVQVKWDERTAKWYPVAFEIMIRLMTSKNPVEFASELLLPFTIDSLRKAENPWQAALQVDRVLFELDPYVERWNYYFERCGSHPFATVMACNPVFDAGMAESIIRNFDLSQIIEAASYHGDIGEAPRSLDSMAKAEQRLVSDSDESIKLELRNLGAAYLNKYGFKFLVSAKDKSAAELKAILIQRSQNSREQEIQNAREALWQITAKRFAAGPADAISVQIASALERQRILGAQVAVCDGHEIQQLQFGRADTSGRKVLQSTRFQIASLSKTIGTVYAMEYFAARGISLDTPVNQLLEKSGSKFRLTSDIENIWASEVQLRHLMNHSALNMHYVNGFRIDQPMPASGDILLDPSRFKYDAINVISKPGTVFRYSGGGFMVLEHLIEALEKRSIRESTRAFFAQLGVTNLSFDTQAVVGADYANGYLDDDLEVPGGRFQFPAFAAGALGTASDVLQFLRHIGRAYIDLNGSGGISHDTAVQMLHGRDLGCRKFMGCDMGLGVFVAEMGANRVILHQGANDGFRAIFVYVCKGPDRDKGFVIFCNADNRGVLFIAEASQILLKHLGCQGFDLNRLEKNFDYSKLSQEQIVNLGFKQLILSAFEEDLPEPIVRPSVTLPWSDRNLLVDAQLMRTSNQRFSRAVNLTSPFEPVFDPKLFERQGKVMDSWETVRHNREEFDFAEFKLKSSGKIRWVMISTKYHDGNQVPAVRLLGRLETSAEWKEFLPKIGMDGHAQRLLKLDPSTESFGEVRVEVYPDGGLTRLGLYEDIPEKDRVHFKAMTESKSHRFSEAIPKSQKPLTIPYRGDVQEVVRNIRRCKSAKVDWASTAFGGKILRAGNEHYSPAVQVISPFPAIHMFDGLESARSRTPGHFEEVIIGLGKEIELGEVILDFEHFVNNNPRSVRFFAPSGKDFVPICEEISVKAFAANQKSIKFGAGIRLNQLMVRIYPDGGINRIHVFDRG